MNDKLEKDDPTTQVAVDEKIVLRVILRNEIPEWNCAKPIMRTRSSTPQSHN